jgi:hypothetical protein
VPPSTQALKHAYSLPWAPERHFLFPPSFRVGVQSLLLAFNRQSVHVPEKITQRILDFVSPSGFRVVNPAKPLIKQYEVGRGQVRCWFVRWTVCLARDAFVAVDSA